ncbi:hypothetical protein E4634_17330 [Mangrovimicrobium sediminis]|uniref:Lipopolysaccharide biosynthesis protein n=1 Tax=Mangrovimicrobium sediminis TaxID=2562682 RepID=A0A4Z0LWZ9_9GAMM|nr:hypothetical protein [Haliea sp. SAOS-164]TGD71872.1 hypothetical protein E4634_17330 [Haliea sp. SAOS-164]
MSALNEAGVEAAALESGPSLQEYIAGMKRRWKPMVIFGGAMLVLALALALLWPPTFTASSTILIEEQEIPTDMVRSTINSYATQQIETIRARVLTLQNISRIIEKYNLYTKEEMATIPRAKMARNFIDSVDLDLQNAAVLDPRSGRPMQATIAFRLSYSAETAQHSMVVTNELTNLFLNENLRTRQELTSSTAEFMREEARKANEEVHEIEGQIAQFKGEHQGALPDNALLNLQNSARYQSQLNAVETRLQELSMRELDLKTQLSTTSKYAPVVLPTGERVLGDVDRLKALQSEYSRVSARYSENHPDVIRLKREIDTLLARFGGGADKQELQRMLAARKDELSALQSKYSDDYPEVQAMQQIVDQLEGQLAETGADTSAPEPDNPTYLMLDNQLQDLQIEKRALAANAEQLRKDIERLRVVMAEAPAVEREYQNLRRNLEVASSKYLDLKAKLKDAELAGELEAGRKGQRFTLLEPPVLPSAPSSPNRKAIFLAGFTLAVILALGVGLLLEALDGSVRSARRLGDLMGEAPLVSIPYIQTPVEQRAREPNKKLLMLGGIALAALVILLLVIHFFIQPLDVLWYSTLGGVGVS